MLHKSGEIEVSKDILGAGLNGLCNFTGLVGVMANFAHLADQDMMVAWVRYLPIEPRKYLGSISGHEPCQES